MNNVNSIESLEEKGYKRRKVDGVDYMVKPYHVPRHILKIEGDKAVRIMGEVREKVLRVLDNRDDRSAVRNDWKRREIGGFGDGPRPATIDDGWF